jgi:hypothetical protein
MVRGEKQYAIGELGCSHVISTFAGTFDRELSSVM